MPDATHAIDWSQVEAALQTIASEYGILIDYKRSENLPTLQWYVTDGDAEAYGATLTIAMDEYARLQGKAVQA